MIDATGTSFHGTMIRATVRQMAAVLGDPTHVTNTGEDKVNIEWVRRTDSGDVYTVYDWKVGRPLADDDETEWHIGAHSQAVAEQARTEIYDTSKKCFG